MHIDNHVDEYRDALRQLYNTMEPCYLEWEPEYCATGLRVHDGLLPQGLYELADKLHTEYHLQRSRYDDWQHQRRYAKQQAHQRFHQRFQTQINSANHASGRDDYWYANWACNITDTNGRACLLDLLRNRWDRQAKTAAEVRTLLKSKDWLALYMLIRKLRSQEGLSYDHPIHRKLPDGVWDAFMQARDRYSSGHWKYPSDLLRAVGVDPNENTVETYRPAEGCMFPHVSKDDSTQIAYCPSIEYLLRDRLVRTKPGRFLTKFFSKTLTELEIKKVVESYELADKIKRGEVPVQFIENTDPQGWEDVYEHGRGFSSCMVYKHPNERHLHCDLHGENHPVRAYAHPDNNLRLAYLGTRDAVYARSIVRERKRDDGKVTKTYVRCYGDDRLKSMLKSLGYEEDRDLDGEVLRARYHPNYDGHVILPYLDGCDGVRFDAPTMTLTIGEGGIESCSSGYSAIQDEHQCCCEMCDEYYHEDDMHYVESEDRRVCRGCLDEYYVYAFSSYQRARGNAQYFREDRCVCVDGNYYLEDSDVLAANNIYECEESGEYYHQDDLRYTSRGMIHEDYCTELDRPDLNGNDWAHEDDTITVTHEGEELTIHEDCADQYPEDEEDTDEEEENANIRDTDQGLAIAA